MSSRHKIAPARLGLGVGMDLPWSAKGIGFVADEAGDDVTPRMKKFFAAHADTFAYHCFAFQPKNRCRLHIDDYAAAYDALYAACPTWQTRAFHHTLLNLATPETYDRREIIAFTNALVERYNIGWIVEDVGIWSLRGKALPYPQPPLLTKEGLAASVRNVKECQRSLHVPLLLEFPGFSEGVSVWYGELDAFDYFNELVEQTQSWCTLDVGHLLSWQWMHRRAEAPLSGFERLPLERCAELHLSGCHISDGRFRDLHHGVLLDQQIEALDYLLAYCPNLRAVTYEDPKYGPDGAIPAKARRNFERLQQRVSAWRARGEQAAESSQIEVTAVVLPQPTKIEQDALEAEAMTQGNTLWRVIHDRSFRAQCKQDLTASNESSPRFHAFDAEELDRLAERVIGNLSGGNHDGSVGLCGAFPRTFAELARLGQNPSEVIAGYVESADYDDFRDVPYTGLGLCAEEAFAHYLIRQETLIAARPENRCMILHELYLTLMQVLAVNRTPAFVTRTRVHRTTVSQWLSLRLPSALASEVLGEPTADPVRMAYVATLQAFHVGPVPPVVVQILLAYESNGDPSHALAESLRISEPVIRENVRMMREIGWVA